MRFVVLIIGNSRSNHFGAQGTFNANTVVGGGKHVVICGGTFFG